MYLQRKCPPNNLNPSIWTGYYITFEGILLLKNGGYSQEKINVESKEKHELLMEKIASQTNIQIGKLTFWASISAVGLLIVAILTFYYQVWHK